MWLYSTVLVISVNPILFVPVYLEQTVRQTRVLAAYPHSSEAILQQKLLPTNSGNQVPLTSVSGMLCSITLRIRAIEWKIFIITS